MFASQILSVSFKVKLQQFSGIFGIPLSILLKAASCVTAIRIIFLLAIVTGNVLLNLQQKMCILKTSAIRLLLCVFGHCITLLAGLFHLISSRAFFCRI